MANEQPSSWLDAVFAEIRNEIALSFEEQQRLWQSCAGAIAASKETQQPHKHSNKQITHWAAFERALNAIDKRNKKFCYDRTARITVDQLQSKPKKHRSNHGRALCRQREQHSQLIDPALRLTIQAETLCKWHGFTQRAKERSRLYQHAWSHYTKVIMWKLMAQWRRVVERQQKYRRIGQGVSQLNNANTISTAFTIWKKEFYSLQAAHIIQKRQRVARQYHFFVIWRFRARIAYSIHHIRAKRIRTTMHLVVVAWKEYTRQCHKQHQLYQVAQQYFLWRSWQRFKRQTRRRFQLRRSIDTIRRTRNHRRILLCVHIWCEYIDKRKRWRFAEMWHRQHVHAKIIDRWQAFQAIIRQQYAAIQDTRHWYLRRWIRWCFRAWWKMVLWQRNRRAQLLRFLEQRKRRCAFFQLKRHAYALSQREHVFQMAKARRMVWKWYFSAQEAKRLNQLISVVKQRAADRFVRRVGWKPWRQLYMLMVKERYAISILRKKRLKVLWLNFINVILGERERRLHFEHAVFALQWRRLRQSLSTWVCNQHQTVMSKKQAAMGDQFYLHKALERSFRLWKWWKDGQNEEQTLIYIGGKALLKRMLRQWAHAVHLRMCIIREKLYNFEMKRLKEIKKRYLEEWKACLVARNTSRCKFVIQQWQDMIRQSHRQRQMAGIARRISLRWRWCQWIKYAAHSQQLHKMAQFLINKQQVKMKHHFFVGIWWHKVQKYRLVYTKLRNMIIMHTLMYVFGIWKQKKANLDAKRRAAAFYDYNLRRRYLNKLFQQTIKRNVAIREYCQQRQYSKSWKRWFLYLTRRRRKRQADKYFQRYWRTKVVFKWHAMVVDNTKQWTQRAQAIEFHRVMSMQSVFIHWDTLVKKRKHCCHVAQSLEMRQIGRNAFIQWRRTWIERTKAHEMARFHDIMLVKRTWNALVQVTKRKQVACAMWKYTMNQIRESKAMHRWRQYVIDQRAIQKVVDYMHRDQQTRLLRLYFRAWGHAVVVHAFTVISAKKQLDRIKATCWLMWTRYLIYRQWKHIQRRKLLEKVFVYGFKRFLRYVHAVRTVRLRNNRRILEQTLAKWRVEWWLRLCQTRTERDIKYNVLLLWKEFVGIRRQKRLYQQYIQGLHRMHQSRLDKRRANRTRVFCDAYVLQLEWQKSRQVMKRVLHGWRLLVLQRRHHRRQTQNQSLLVADKESLLSVEDGSNSSLFTENQHQVPTTPLKSTQIDALIIQEARMKLSERLGAKEYQQGRMDALEFWAQHLVDRCFDHWKQLIQHH